MSAPKYKPGDRVVGTGILFGRKYGSIVKPAKTSALVRWDDADEDERVNLQHIVPETAEHVATRERKRHMEEWRAARPETALARVTYSRFGSNADESGAEVGHAKTPAEMRQAADELLKLAGWFEQRPAERSKP